MECMKVRFFILAIRHDIMFLTILLFASGLLLLVKGADYFVRSASRLAKLFGVSEFIIGMTLVAFGTSLPEFVNIITASLAGHNELVLGNVVGSNVLNITLILGIAAIVHTIRINRAVLGRDVYLLTGVSCLLLVSAWFGPIGRWAGLFFITVYAAYIVFLVRSKERYRAQGVGEFITFFLRFEYVTTLAGMAVHSDNPSRVRKRIVKKVLPQIGILIASFVCIVYGSSLVVDSAVSLAELLGVSQTIIAVSMVAIGTTLPEFSVTISALRKGYSGLVIGNLVGSNIANALLILGAAAIIRPIAVPHIVMTVTLPLMAIISFIVFLFMRSDREVTRKEGFALVSLYAIFLLAVFVAS